MLLVDIEAAAEVVVIPVAVLPAMVVVHVVVGTPWLVSDVFIVTVSSDLPLLRKVAGWFLRGLLRRGVLEGPLLLTQMVVDEAAIPIAFSFVTTLSRFALVDDINVPVVVALVDSVAFPILVLLSVEFHSIAELRFLGCDNEGGTFDTATCLTCGMDDDFGAMTVKGSARIAGALPLSGGGRMTLVTSLDSSRVGT